METTNTFEQELKIPVTRIDDFYQWVKLMNKMAKDLDLSNFQVVEGLQEEVVMPERHLSIATPEAILGHPVFLPEIKYQAIPVTITGELPEQNGYSMVGYIQKESINGEMKNVSYCAPNMNISKRILDKFTGQCDHCKINRTRVKGFIIKKNGRYKIVGTKCIDDFTEANWNTPDLLSKYFENIRDMQLQGAIGAITGAEREDWGDSSSGYGENGYYHYPLALGLSRAYALVRMFGFVSKKDSSQLNNPTSYYMSESPWSAYKDRSKEEHQAVEKFHELEVEAVKEKYIDKLIAWAKTQANSDNSYLRKLANIAEVGLFNNGTKHGAEDAIVCSMIPAFDRVTESRKRYTAKVSNYTDSTPIGNVGQRLEQTVKVLNVRVLPNSAFSSTLVKMGTTDGNILTWFASNVPEELNKEGNSANIKATVKKVNSYQGIVETQISRVVVI